MHPRIFVRHSTCHTDWACFRLSKRHSIFTKSVRTCVLCLSLTIAHAIQADNHLISDEQEHPLTHKQNATLSLPVITQENGRFTVFDLQLREHTFQQDTKGRYSALNSPSSTLQQTANGQLQWTDSSGRQHRFAGSSTILSSDEECSPSTTTQPESQDANADTPSGAPQEAPVNPVDPTNTPTEEDEPQQCDTNNEEGPHIFQPVPSGTRRTTLDARPESCESYFVQYYGTKRGFEIEAALQQHPPYNEMQPTVRNFPVIDFIDDSTFYVVHSRDLGNRTFNSPARPDALLDQLLKDGEEIQTRIVDVLHEEGSISATELGKTTTITEDQLRPVTLQLVIRDGIASADHWRQIDIAREQLMRLYGITLEVVVIP